MVTEALKTIDDRMKNAIKLFRADLATIRTGHASPALVEHIKVEYAGVPTPLNQIAGISAPEASLLVIQPWDKSCINEVVKALQNGITKRTNTNNINILILFI